MSDVDQLALVPPNVRADSGKTASVSEVFASQVIRSAHRFTYDS
jgi:hypothetical protein